MSEKKLTEKELEAKSHLEQYQMTLHLIWNAHRTFRAIDFDDLLSKISRLEAIGPVVDPTLYRAKHKKMEYDKEVLTAARAFVSKLTKLADDGAAGAYG